MATCNVGQLSLDACADGFMWLDDATAEAVEIQLLKNISGDASTTQQLLAQACANGFTSLDMKTAEMVYLQLLCNLQTT
jgi:hypothetical protein